MALNDGAIRIVDRFATKVKLTADNYLRFSAYELILQLVKETNVDTGNMRVHFNVSVNRLNDYYDRQLRRQLLRQKRRRRYGTELSPARALAVAQRELVKVKMGDTVYIQNLTPYAKHTKKYGRLQRLLKIFPARAFSVNIIQQPVV